MRHGLLPRLRHGCGWLDASSHLHLHEGEWVATAVTGIDGEAEERVNPDVPDILHSYRIGSRGSL